jgi:hypothetical protein
MKTSISQLIFLLFFSNQIYAQLGIKETNTPPNLKAMLDVDSPNKGVLIPRMSTTTRDGIGSPPAGLMIYNSTTNQFNYWNGTVWSDFNSAPLTLPFTGTGTENFGGQAGLMKILNTGTGNGLYVKSGSGAQTTSNQLYAAYFESSENGIFAGGGAGKMALKTSGNLALAQNNEGLNKILTSVDPNGLARWESAANLTGLNVDGPTTLGINGTAITEIIKVSSSENIPSVGPLGTTQITISVPNAQVNSVVHVSPTTNLPNGLVITHALCKVAGSVEVKFYNANSVGSIDPPVQTFHVTVIR